MTLRRVAAGAAAPALVACAVLAPLALHWATGSTLSWFDTQRLYAPQRWLVDEALRALRLPLWDPYMGAGMPLLAEAIHGVLHPVSVATAWLGTSRSADLLVGGHVACAAAGAAWLVRDLGASRAGAALAALAYAMSGFVLSMAGNLVFLAGAGTLPLCVAGLRRFAASPAPASLALAAATTAALALSGDVQALVVGGALALALAGEAGGWRGALRAVVAGTAGLLVAAVQLVPSAVHLPRTVRGAEGWSAEPAVWALGPWRVVELVLPGLAAGPDAYADPVFGALAGPGGWPGYTTPMPFAASVFVGLLPVTLALAGARSGRRGVILGGAAVLLLWAALGPALGADRILGHLPLWRTFRYPEKLVGPLTLTVAALAALGLDAVADGTVRRRDVGAAGAVLALAAAVACRAAFASLEPPLAALAEVRLRQGSWHLLLAAAAGGGWLLLRDRLGAAASRAALAGIAWAGMAAASPAALRPGDPEARLRAPGPVLDAPPPGPRVVTPYLHDLHFEDPGPAAIDRAAREHALLAYPAYNVRARLDSLNEYSAAASARLAALGGDAWSHWPLAPRRYGATHVIVDPPASPAEAALRARATAGGSLVAAAPGRYEIWAVPHRPWASFAGEVLATPDERVALAWTAQAIVDGSDRVVVESFGAFAAGQGRVLAVERGLESLRVEAEAPVDGTLVVADAWWPGWEATLDGVVVPVFRADALVRAVRWPAGRHVLAMSYRPPEVRAGLAVSALGAVAVVAGCAALARCRAGRGARPERA